jgi:hypothetical protein
MTGERGTDNRGFPMPVIIGPDTGGYLDEKTLGSLSSASL